MKRQKLHDEHMYLLTQLVEKWKSETGLSIPYFDPDDGGVNARMLFLFEKPGPSIFADTDFGFVSQDNDDPTARAVKDFLHQADIPRSEIVIWNAIAAWNGTRRVGRHERAFAPGHLRELLVVLRHVNTIVQVGREAGKVLRGIGGVTNFYSVVPSLHPSPINKNRRRLEWEEIPKIWASAARLAGISPPFSVDDAVDLICLKLGEQQKQELGALNESELIQTHRTVGQWIRKELELFKGNTELLKATGCQHPDDASAVILKAVWQRLQAK